MQKPLQRTGVGGPAVVILGRGGVAPHLRRRLPDSAGGPAEPGVGHDEVPRDGEVEAAVGRRHFLGRLMGRFLGRRQKLPGWISGMCWLPMSIARSTRTCHSRCKEPPLPANSRNPV